MNHAYDNISVCRLCSADTLDVVMTFGEQYLASCFVKSNDKTSPQHVKVPLTLVLCRKCGHVQLRETVNRDLLFRDYFYRSATNPMMRDALREVAEDVIAHTEMKPGDIVLDVGCNDGIMLSMMPEEFTRIGVEPARNISWEQLDPSIRVINGYFNEASVRRATNGSQCQIVTTIAMLYSVEDAGKFAAQVKSILAPNGTWCAQLTYLPTTLQNLGFYDVCHEHLHYFSLGTVKYLMENRGFKIVDASLNGVNGGSLRVHITHGENRRVRVSDNVALILEEEEALRLRDRATYVTFYERVVDLRQKVVGIIDVEKRKGRLVIGLGASTKGNVLLQFFQLDRDRLPYLSDRSPSKEGLRTLGADIEVISEERARELNPSCMLVLIWHFKQEIIKREEAYLRNGGSLLFPMPYCHLVTAQGERRL